MKQVYLAVAAGTLAAILALGTAQAKSSSSHSSSSTHSSTRSTTSKSLPAGTHFVRKTCKTAACRAKHPGGSYMLPIKPKKRG